MHHYRISGLSIASELALPAVPVSGPPDSGVDVVIRQAPVPIKLEGGIAHGPAWQIANDRFLLRLPGFVRCLFSGGRRIDFEMENGTPAEEIIAILTGPAIGILLHQRKRIVLHASAISVGGKAVLFCGASGMGKSTLAAALNQRGFPLFTDDLCTLVDDGAARPTVLPDGRHMKLWEQAIDHLDLGAWRGDAVRSKIGKYYVNSTAAANESLPLGALYALRWSRPGIARGIERPARIVDAALVVRRNAYRPQLVKHLGQKTDYFQAAGRIVETAGVFYLTQDFDLRSAPETITALVRHWSEIGLTSPPP